MILSTKEVLSSKKGIAEALGIVFIAMTLLIAVGAVIGNYAILSKTASQLQSITQEISNRAETYASVLNVDLVNPQTPVGVGAPPVCSATPPMCTKIIGETKSTDGKTIVLRIQGDTLAAFGQTVTKDVTLVSSEVTHVTAIDADGNNVWALSNEGLRYKTWSVATGKPSTVTPDELAGPTAGNNWVNVDDRAGIDSTGSLWVWGKNNVGQAGIGSITTADAKPTRIAGTTRFRSVVTGDDRAYAIDSTGTSWAWGKNDKGQLGLGNTTNALTPTKITGTRMMSFAIGKDNVFGITMSGDLVVVGASQTGFPANPGLGSQVLNPGTKYKAVAASTAGAVAMIDVSGTLTMAGNAYPFTSQSYQVFTNVSLGSTAGYAMGTDGFVYTWGLGANGQLGLGATSSASIPTQVTGTKFVSVQGGATSALAIDVTGALYYFGKTPSGYVGGTDLPQVTVPTKLMPENKFRATASNSGDSVAALLDSAGNVYGMGTAAPGLWPMTYGGVANQPVRMPVPDGFSSYTWK